MKRQVGMLVLACCMSAGNVLAGDAPASVCFEEKPGGLALIENGRPLPVVVEEGADPAVLRVAASFAEDLARVSGEKAEVHNSVQRVHQPLILIGALGKSRLIDGLVAQKKISVDTIKGQWEAYQVAVVDNPWPNVDKALVIVGSDRRGTVFGAYDLSAKMGVSPWYWFADVPVERRRNVTITAGARDDKPVVRYRGIFINDEDPALSGWAANQFGGVNADMYERVFELILRLKGNYIWPAMWNGRTFHTDDPRNTVLADDMGIVMGTSHHEPMTRAQKEWRDSMGPWDYSTNAEKLRTFWRGGIERMMSKGDGTGYDTLVTVGMRGDGDKPMSEGTAIKLLETIVADQRAIIANVTKRPADQTPQVWALYKEVLDYYDQGMTVPDDVILLFADDNWGQVRRLPLKKSGRKGGYGIYYHFDYVGGPRSYKWTDTVQVGKVWQQMNLAYESGARALWVVNVGDIKPVEYPIDFFLTMAWNPEAMSAEALSSYAARFAAQSFGKALAADVGDLIERYGTLAAERKPELLDQNTYPIGQIDGDKLVTGEFYRHLQKWKQLEQDLETVKGKIGQNQYAAFYQLVEWPIASMSNLYEMYFAAAWNAKLAKTDDARANHFLEIVKNNFAHDAALTDKYHQINDGKWKGMVNQVHIGYTDWRSPKTQIMPPVKEVATGATPTKITFAAADNDDAVQTLEASDFTKASNKLGFTWTQVPHLGQSRAALVALPQGRAPTRVEDEVYIEYSISQPADGKMTLAIELSPTIDTRNAGGIRLAVSLGDRPAKEIRFELHSSNGHRRTPQESAWCDAMIHNKHVVTVEFDNVPKGNHPLRVYRLDDNVVIEKLLVRSSEKGT